MYKKEETLYLSGAVNMASQYSKYMGPSYMDAVCFDKVDFIKYFKEYFQILEEFTTIEIDLSQKEFLKNILGDDKKLIDSLDHIINLELGKYKKIYTIDENSNLQSLLGRENNGNSIFYFVEDIFFIEYKDTYLTLIIGNDE